MPTQLLRISLAPIGQRDVSAAGRLPGLTILVSPNLAFDRQCHGNSDSNAARRRLASSDETDIYFSPVSSKNVTATVSVPSPFRPLIGPRSCNRDGSMRSRTWIGMSALASNADKLFGKPFPRFLGESVKLQSVGRA